MAWDIWALWLSLAVGAAVLCLFWWCRYSRQFARRGVAYVSPLPYVGNMLSVALKKKSISKRIAELYEKLEPYPCGGVFYFTKPTFMVRDPELIRAITIKDFDHFMDHIDFGATKKANPLIAWMLVWRKGKDWQDMRHTLSPTFTSMKMKNMFELITEIGQQMGEYLTKRTAEYEASSRNGSILTLEMKDFSTRVTNDVIATAAFGVKVDSLSEPNNTFYTMGRRLTSITPFVVLGYMLSTKLMELLGISIFDATALEFFRSIVLDTIRTREEQGIVRHDMIHLLMEARRGEMTPKEGEKDSSDDGWKRRLTDDDMAAQALAFFFGGFETVSTVLSFCSHLLATHEDVQRRLQQEVDRLMDSSGGRPSYDQVTGCQYLDMVLSESLRLFSPAATLNRVCTRSYRLPATESSLATDLQLGDVVCVPVHGIHHDPKYYPEPERFDPERFNPDNKHLLHPYAYYPFGSGPRSCIARRFALMEMKVLLVYLLSTFNLEVVSKTPLPLQTEPNTIFVSIKGGAWLGIRRRTLPHTSSLGD